MTNLASIDANLILALDALLAERNVTRAAARLDVGQPAMSHSLGHSREHFGDPLLVAKGRELVLTPRARTFVVPVAANGRHLPRYLTEIRAPIRARRAHS